MRVWRLEPLTDEEVATVVRRALEDAERGLAGSLGPGRRRGARRTRRSITSSGWPVATRGPRSTCSRARSRSPRPRASATRTGRVAPRLEDVEAAAQQRVLAYDRAGDGHYDTVSAFIKSLRGNDPDAALYWLASMVAAGEDPRFIARRLIISASEDVGNADPRALQVAVAAAQALDHVGLPEAQYALAQATTYIATAPKSNRSGSAYWAAVGDVEARGSLAVPLHLRQAPATGGCSSTASASATRYPHDFEDADVDQQYLPDELGRPALLPAHRPGLRGDDRQSDGGPRGGAGGASPSARARRARDRRGCARPAIPRDEPQEARPTPRSGTRATKKKKKKKKRRRETVITD